MQESTANLHDTLQTSGLLMLRWHHKSRRTASAASAIRRVSSLYDKTMSGGRRKMSTRAERSSWRRKEAKNPLIQVSQLLMSLGVGGGVAGSDHQTTAQS